MIILIIIGAWFYRLAVNKNQNKFLWPTLAIAAYFIMQLIAGVFIGLVNPAALDNTVMIYFIGVGSGAVGVAIVYFILNKTAENAKEKSSSNSDLIDDNF